LSNASNGLGQTYVLLRGGADPTELPLVLGFYTLAQTAIDSGSAQRILPQVRVPRYDIGASLLARLAVDRRCQGRRLGETLLVDAIERVRLVLAQVSGLCLFVDAKDKRAQRFYARYGFEPLDGADEGEGHVWPRRLFLSRALIEALGRSHSDPI
jgi:GNAT superfamily N-acetyltransferase